MTKIGLEFLENTGGDSEGLSESGIEFFKDRPFAAVAREMGQNSRDARLDADKPVRITFDVLSIKASEFPSIEEFRAAATVCLEKADRPRNEKEKGFFQHAVQVLDASEITVLKIADYNTKGATGPCEEGRPFHTLAKTEGSSTKEDISSGGSFGIGKNAVFALSDIHTAFFSTQYKDENGSDHFLCMGKTLFISHRDKAGKQRRRKGYWGRLQGYMPLDNPKEIPAWMLRETRGTSIFSICMRHNKTDWRYEMAAAIIMNFFCAIEQREMEFEIDKGSIKINRNTLQSMLRDAKILEAVKQLNASEPFEVAKNLHACLIDEKTIISELDVPELGKVRVSVLLRDGLNYTVGIIRNGMYITKSLSHFNEPFKNFPLYRDFSAIIEPVGKGEGEWFKRLEGPRHDDLSAERISDPALREQGQRAFERLAKQIRARLKGLARTEAKSKIELDELSDFFASDQTRQEDDAATETDPKALKPTPVMKSPPKKKTVAAAKSEDEDQPPVDGPGDQPISEKPGDIPGFGEGHGDGEGDGDRDNDPKPKGRPEHARSSCRASAI
ncbi:hypothetical protein FNB15_04840 [Ferrovibrio terrae]|uniref:Uncharacterized protein n=1 Tax=Ferrovibrio terrae TaxID=2594003 RepID=A0A516GYN3_9PROT|nr:hypothetical protein [Ferrovibrio terrae]QDO96644.1 hypothetical protein FNB15_04840 [Ferrovibrio terrae]